MKGETLFIALGDVDDRFIEESAQLEKSMPERRRAVARILLVRRFAPIAACLAIALTALLALPRLARRDLNGMSGGAPRNEIIEYAASDRDKSSGDGGGAENGGGEAQALPEEAPIPAPEAILPAPEDAPAPDDGAEIDSDVTYTPPFPGETLTLDEAQSDPDFGAFVPSDIPDGFAFEGAYRDRDSLLVSYRGYYDYIEIRVSKVTENDLSRLVRADERERYDLALYPVPFSESVPRELREVVDNPVFNSGEMSLDLVLARARVSGESGVDAGKWKIDFSVLYEEILVSVNSKGAAPEQVWELLRS